MLLCSAAYGIEHGIASIYSTKCNNSTKTASGVKLNNSAYTAAHKTLPLGSWVKVKNLRNNKTVVVKIIDRGPYVRGRVIDLTPRAANQIGLTYKQGLAKVQVQRVVFN